MARFRVLVTGWSGFLAPFVAGELERRGHAVTTTGRTAGDHPADLADPAARKEVLARVKPDLCVNLAAMSRMADCGTDPERARQVNAHLPAAMAHALGERLLHVSTDLVFDGHSPPYGEDATASPLSAYGASKAEGEERVLRAGGRVARLPLLFGPDPRDRGATGMVRAGLRERRAVTLFTNEYRTPLHAADAAMGLCDVLLLQGGPGLVHLPGPERVSRWELGRRFCALQGLPGDLLQPAECQDAGRPRDVSLRGVWEAPRSLDEMLRQA
jgi:dTDP-4-dehydrorhamnose reductase